MNLLANAALIAVSVALFGGALLTQPSAATYLKGSGNVDEDASNELALVNDNDNDNDIDIDNDIDFGGERQLVESDGGVPVRLRYHRVSGTGR